LTVQRGHGGEEADLEANGEPKAESLDEEEKIDGTKKGMTSIWYAVGESSLTSFGHSWFQVWYLFLVPVFIF
jgi:hypothetical protein